MIREIKFRAWDGKRMRQVTKLFWGHDENPVLIVHFKDTMSNEPGFLTSVDERLQLMQYSDYIDEDDTPIYEGDIIKSLNGQIEKALVFQSQGAFWNREFDEFWQEWFANEIYYDWKCERKKVGIFHWTANRISVKVIGNIYENPELIPQYNK